MFGNGKRRWGLTLTALALTAAIAGCGGNNGGSGGTQGSEDGEAADKQLQKVKVVLDWTPNTNHTGLYVARDKGFFEEQGLDVEIIQPGQEGADTMVAAGNAEFGVSYQESVTMARVADVPLVSIAAVIQHNTSGFASLKEKGIDSPKKFEGMRYGGWGAPVEEAVIDALMREDGGDVGKVDIMSIGDSDFFAAVKRDIDFAWIYYAWTGVEAELRGEELNMVYLTDYSEKLDYYTPVLVTSEKLIGDDPELVKAFTAGAAAGYQFAIDNPEEAADVLIAAEPDLNPELVKASQKWLSPRYQDDAPRWGEQKLSVWDNYAGWMFERKLLEKELDAEKAFTNEFLPE
ncbi:ABC transporter substrate-binding protein [Paenibacillus soyae]|uniref:ABC transporter substrate-binding protein n=1 Tax=Paenibacillus soyae TaxID=2969249 RepID=A0A9X2MRQ2_9BACL|nr:ABC transporter substrate-binding protein [Paenibacillus soyae]MCR2804944.1 ABC transporter substrate-binding protein [Paenibacillus soyae]